MWVVTDSVAVPEIRNPHRLSGKEKNNRDSTETKKRIKDSDVIRIF